MDRRGYYPAGKRGDPPRIGNLGSCMIERCRDVPGEPATVDGIDDANTIEAARGVRQEPAAGSLRRGRDPGRAVPLRGTPAGYGGFPDGRVKDEPWPWDLAVS